MPMPSSSSQNWQGHLQLVFGCDRPHSTQLQRSQMQAPLKVQRPFYPEGEAICHSVILHTAGGVVGGDRLNFDIHLQPNAKALITTAAASKLYGSRDRHPGSLAVQTTRIRIGSGACLEWLPQETIVFNGARYQQQLRVDLAPDALWLGWEISRFGRTARGERFLQGEWRSQTEIWQNDRPLWIDPQWIEAGEQMLNSPHGLAGCPVVGSFALVGCAIEPDVVQQARHLWAETRSLDSASGIGVTRLMVGLLCRYRGHSTAEARRWFTAVWNLLRMQTLGRSACCPRVWQV